MVGEVFESSSKEFDISFAYDALKVWHQLTLGCYLLCDISSIF